MSGHCGIAGQSVTAVRLPKTRPTASIPLKGCGGKSQGAIGHRAGITESHCESNQNHLPTMKPATTTAGEAPWTGRPKSCPHHLAAQCSVERLSFRLPVGGPTALPLPKIITSITIITESSLTKKLPVWEPGLPSLHLEIILKIRPLLKHSRSNRITV